MGKDKGPQLVDIPGAHKEMDPWMARDNTPVLRALLANWNDVGSRAAGGGAARTRLLSPHRFRFELWVPQGYVPTARDSCLQGSPVYMLWPGPVGSWAIWVP